MDQVRLSATARVSLPTPLVYFNKLTNHFAEHGEVTKAGHKGQIELSYGIATIEAGDDTLLLSAESDDETGLAYMKHAIAEHVIEFARRERPKIVWAGDGTSGGALPYFREMSVVGVSTLSPMMRRVRLRGKDLRRFSYGGLHVRLLIPPQQVAPQWPIAGEDGRPIWPAEEHKLTARVYTIRNIDVERGEVDIDIVIHDETPGSVWVMNAQPGDIVGLTGPGGGGVPDADWQLLAGDETALPAIGRIIEELPAEAKVVARIEVDSALEEQRFDHRCQLDLQWLHRNGRKAGTTTLLQDAVRSVEFPRDQQRIFAWAGCEFTAFKAIRGYLRKERKLDRKQHLVVSYWRQGVEG